MLQVCHIEEVLIHQKYPSSTIGAQTQPLCQETQHVSENTAISEVKNQGHPGDETARKSRSKIPRNSPFFNNHKKAGQSALLKNARLKEEIIRRELRRITTTCDGKQ